MVKTDCGSPQEEWQNLGLCGVPEIKCRKGHRRVSTLAGHEVYSFLDKFNGYNKIQMRPKDQEKTSFVTKWGVFVALVMMFRLKTTPATFQPIIMEIFREFIPTFMQVFLDDFVVYSQKGEHLEHLQLCLEKCQRYLLS